MPRAAISIQGKKRWCRASKDFAAKQTVGGQQRLFPLPFPFHDGNVAVDREIREPLDLAARERPFYFEPIQLFPLLQAQNHAGIVRGKITSAAYLHSSSLQVPRLIGEARAAGI